LAAINQQTYLPLLAQLLTETNQPTIFHERLAAFLADLNVPAARDAVLGTLGTIRHRLQIKLAASLAGNAAGVDALLSLAEQKKLSPQVLNDRTVKERLVAAKLP